MSEGALKLDQILQGSYTTEDGVQFVLKRTPNANGGPLSNELFVLFSNNNGTFQVADKATHSPILPSVPFKFGPDLDGSAKVAFFETDAVLIFGYVLGGKLFDEQNVIRLMLKPLSPL